MNFFSFRNRLSPVRPEYRAKKQVLGAVKALHVLEDRLLLASGPSFYLDPMHPSAVSSAYAGSSIFYSELGYNTPPGSGASDSQTNTGSTSGQGVTAQSYASGPPDISRNTTAQETATVVVTTALPPANTDSSTGTVGVFVKHGGTDQVTVGANSSYSYSHAPGNGSYAQEYSVSNSVPAPNADPNSPTASRFNLLVRNTNGSTASGFVNVTVSINKQSTRDKHFFPYHDGVDVNSSFFNVHADSSPKAPNGGAIWVTDSATGNTILQQGFGTDFTFSKTYPISGSAWFSYLSDHNRNPDGTFTTGTITSVSGLAFSFQISFVSPVSNGSFEAPALLTGESRFAPVGTPWNFISNSTASSGVAGNGSAFTNLNSPIPDATQVAWLNRNASFSQVADNWVAGNYTLTFQAAQCGQFGNHQEDFKVFIDGTSIGTFKPSSTMFQTYSANFGVSAGRHMVTFQGLNTATGDNTVLIDAINLSSPTWSPGTLNQNSTTKVDNGQFAPRPTNSPAVAAVSSNVVQPSNITQSELKAEIPIYYSNPQFDNRSPGKSITSDMVAVLKRKTRLSFF